MQCLPQVEIVNAGPGWAFLGARILLEHLTHLASTESRCCHCLTSRCVTDEDALLRDAIPFKVTQIRNGGLEPRQCAPKSLLILLSPE